MNKLILLCMLVCLIIMDIAGSISPSDQSSRARLEVERFEASYLRIVNAGDVKGQLEMVSHDPAVYSVLDGDIWRKWEAVKAQAEAYVPISKMIGSVVDKQEIISLSADTVLVIIQLHSIKRYPVNKSFPDMSGVLTHVLKREVKGWVMLHEHFSTKQTPELIAWKAKLFEAQKKATEKKN